MARLGLWGAAIAYAEASRDATGGGYEDRSIDRFCESVLLRLGRSEDAYRRYGLRAVVGSTNLGTYRALVQAYPGRDRRGMLLELIETRGERGKWFAAAKEAGFLDVALECAAQHDADPATLVRAARDFGEQDPRFAAAVALHAIGQLLAGGGYDPPVSLASDAARHLLAAAARIGAAEWARQELTRLTEAPCVPGRELIQLAVRTALSARGR